MAFTVTARQVYFAILQEMDREKGAVSVLPRFLTTIAAVEAKLNSAWSSDDESSWTNLWSSYLYTCGDRVRQGLFGITSDEFMLGATKHGLSTATSGISNPNIYIPAAWAYLRGIERTIPRTGANNDGILHTMACKITGCSLDFVTGNYLPWLYGQTWAGQDQGPTSAEFDTWKQLYDQGVRDKLGTGDTGSPKGKDGGNTNNAKDPDSLKAPGSGFDPITFIAVAGGITGIAWFGLHLYDRYKGKTD